MKQMIDVQLRLSTPDEGTAAQLAEKLARLMVGLSAEPEVASAVIDIERYDVSCAHDHDEAAP